MKTLIASCVVALTAGLLVPIAAPEDSVLAPAPIQAAENEGGFGGGGGGGCEETNSCNNNEPDTDPGPDPSGITSDICVAGSGEVKLFYRGGVGSIGVGRSPGVGFPSASNADAWAAIGGGWRGIQVDMYGNRYSPLLGVSWERLGRIENFYTLYNDGYRTYWVFQGTGCNTSAAGLDGDYRFTPILNYAMPSVVHDGWCVTYYEGFLQGPYSRSFEKLPGWKQYDVASRPTDFGRDPSPNGDGIKECGSQNINMAFNEPLVELGRYVGPLRYRGMFVYRVYWPAAGHKFQHIGPEEGRHGPVGTTSTDPNRSELNYETWFLTYPGRYQKNCEAEVTLANGDPPGMLTPEQVKWGKPNAREPLYFVESFLGTSKQYEIFDITTGRVISNDYYIGWSDQDPNYYDMNYCASTQGPDPDVRIGDSPAVPNLELQCVASRENPVVTFASGVSREQSSSDPIQVRANGDTNAISWGDQVDVDVNAPASNQVWQTRFAVPTGNAGEGKNSPSNKNTNNLNDKGSQPFGTVPFEEVDTQNNNPTSTWEMLNVWEEAEGPKEGLGWRFYEAAVQGGRYMETTPSWWWQADVLTRIQVIDSLRVPQFQGSTVIEARPSNTSFETRDVRVGLKCTGRPAGLQSLRLATTG